ncbi:hypothetical protein TSUD_396840 [Trifolium subterraneum]|uniref:Uncharacterized protein n=1 Tax=Trifolium subterraneum TaxID=3900 RepID=A0A2Z6P975_TRISU|nr:hypothetical protein TSUD_396840 [Trifolium subterraneum]
MYRRQRSSTPENNRSRSRSRSPRPAPQRNAERPLSPPRDNPRRQNHPPPQRNNHISPPRNRRSPPRRNNRSPPRNGEAAARGGNVRHSPRRESPGSGDERHRGPLSRRIMDIPLPRGLEKPPTLDKYDGTTDPDEHVQSVETALDYRNLRGSIKCKLFPLSLIRGASTWWRNLPPGSIDSWEELCRMFTAHFTTSRRHPKTVASLKAIVQGLEESLRNYIERFNKVSVEVEATDKMKLYLLEEGLREGTKFQEAVGIVEVQTLDAFFELAQQYIKWEDKQKASEVRRPKTFEVGGPSSQREERRGDEKKMEGGKFREAKPPKSQFTYHTPLNTPRDRILSEISSAEFKSAGIRFPKQLPAKPKPWGYVDLIVTFGENKAMKSVKIKFLVVDCPSLYNCIIGRPTLAELFAVSSTIHLKLKYYTKDGRVATINGDIEAARRCFEATSKNLNSVVTPKKKKEETKLSGVNSISIEDGVELDARTSKKERKQEKKAIKDDLLIKENYCPIPDGEFELVPLGEDPTKGVKIGVDLHDLVKRQLKACLRENAELFAWSAAEMPGIDPEVACHQLTIDPRASVVVQRRRKQSPEKAEAARKAVKDLLEANFIAEAQYTTWLSNVVLVKKSNGKWRMCVDYTDLNSVCPKDAYPLPNIDKLVDNSSGFKLLSFMDAYSGYNQIKMAEIDKKKTAFMTETGNYYYNVMPFGLKNAGATYQRIMNKVFHNEIGDMLEVYMDDMIVKSEEEIDHTVHLKGLRRSITTPKRALSEPPVLTRPVEGEKLYLYLAVASEAISAVLIRETEQGQKSVYFVSRALQGPELRYLQIEKIALAVIIAARKLRYYFLAHSVVIRTDQPVKQLQARPDMVGRMLKWSLELAEFDISFESRKALKVQVLADFVAEMTTSMTSEKNKWTIFVDGSSNSQGSGAGIILENGDEVLIEVSHGLSFPTTNNQAKYEAFLAGLRLAEDMGAEEIKIFTDSQLVASQVSGEYQTKEERLLEYLNLIKTKLAKFKETEVKHVPREHNARADVLSKLASTGRKKAGNQSLIQKTLTKSSIEKAVEVMHICAIDEQSWMAPVYNFLKSNTLPVDAKEATKIRKRACSYVLLGDKLYRRGFSIRLLKCVEETRVGFILQEIHEGINGKHIGERSLARKALRAGQRAENADLPVAFAWWGMDILGPFPTAARQVKYLIVAVDYFTKWIEAEPLTKIGASHILRFFKRNVLARFGIPRVVVTDNGTQFTNKKFQEFLATIGTTQHFTSVEHPQTNGQAETANRVILRGLRRRIGASKGNWTEELHNVLWSYRTTPHSTTRETPFRITYRTEAVIPVEIGEPYSRIEYPHEEDINDELLREELDLIEELRTGASLREATLKQKIVARHDKRVIKREFEVGSLVLRRNQKDSREGKLTANWEGSYRVRAKTENRAYHLEDLYGKEIPRTWNAEKLKQYYS